VTQEGNEPGRLLLRAVAEVAATQYLASMKTILSSKGRTVIPRSFVVFLLLATADVVRAQEKTLFADPFTDKLADGWSWVREDPKGWRLDKGTLVIRTSPGGLFMKDNSGRNIALRTPPEVKEGKLAVEVLTENEPTNMYENSGLIWYYDDDNYTILVKEKIGADAIVHLFSERDGKPGTAFHKKFTGGKEVWFRMEVEPGKLSGLYRTSAKEEWQKLGQCDLLPKREPKIGLTTAYAARDAEHFTRFSGFRMLQVAMVAGKP
jgi:hypothetical protein